MFLKHAVCLLFCITTFFVFFFGAGGKILDVYFYWFDFYKGNKGEKEASFIFTFFVLFFFIILDVNEHSVVNIMLVGKIAALEITPPRLV